MLSKGLQDRDSLIILEAFLREYGITHHQTSSFNDFVERDIESLDDVLIDPVVLSNGTLLHFRFGQVRYRQPVLVDDDNRVVKMYPALARSRGESYSAAVHVDIHIFTTTSANVKLDSLITQQGINRRRKRDLILNKDINNQDDGITSVELSPGIHHRVQPMVKVAMLPGE